MRRIGKEFKSYVMGLTDKQATGAAVVVVVLFVVAIILQGLIFQQSSIGWGGKGGLNCPFNFGDLK